MTFDAPLVLTRRGRGGRLVAGTVAAAAGPTLLPHSFRARVKQGLPRPEEVRLGSTPFYRYGNLHIRGLPGTMTLYATPTSDGVATITCSDDGTVDAAFRIDCGRIASTVRLIGVSTYPLGHSPAYASLLSDTFGRLRADSRRPLAALSGTTTASERAAAAQQLAGAYTTAADRLSAAHVTPIVRDEQASVIAALRGCAHAYRSAATAATAEAAVAPGNTTTANGARTQAAAAYRSAQSAVAAASGRLSRALRGLSSLGYTVAGQR